MADIFKEIKSKRGEVASIHSAFKDYPQGVEAHFHFHEKILFGDGPLDRSERKEKLERFSKILTKEPWKAHVEFLKLIHEGFSHPEALHATMVVSYFNFVNRCVHA